MPFNLMLLKRATSRLPCHHHRVRVSLFRRATSETKPNQTKLTARMIPRVLSRPCVAMRQFHSFLPSMRAPPDAHDYREAVPAHITSAR